MAEVPERSTYNLPGFGLVRVRLFPCAHRVYEFLEGYDHLRELRRIPQLGPLTEVFPGAHHTRFEYLMAQLALLTELCHLEGHLPAGLSLGTDRATFGEVPGAGKRIPSNGEVLMVLALLANIGHLPSTFAGERALVKYLRDNTSARTSFRAGLAPADRPLFDRTLKAFDVYRIAYFIALFQLNRYRRKSAGDAMADFCQAVLRSYLTTRDDDPDQALAALWRLYRTVRRITYLSLDSLYAPVPFSIDLSSLFLSLEHFLVDVFTEGTTYQLAFDRLDEVMRDVVYLAPNSQLAHGGASAEALLALQSAQPQTITELRGVLCPTNVRRDLFAGTADSRALHPALTVQLTRDVDYAISTQLIEDPVAWEELARERVGLRSCRFAVDFDPPRQQLRVAAGLFLDVDPSVARKIAFRVAKQLTDLLLEVEERVTSSSRSKWSNGRRLLNFLCKASFGTDKNFRFRAGPILDVPPTVSLYGSTRAGHEVSRYKAVCEARGDMGADALNELAVLEDTLRTIPYKGAVLSFVGSTEVIFDGRQQAEFDGVVFLLSRDLREGPVIVVEAKNVSNGHTVAEAALRTKMSNLGITDYDVTHVGRKGAFARIRF